MKIKEYDTDELLLIANNVTGEYTDKQVRQAKLELYNRGVDDKVIADIMEEKEEAFMRRLDAAARAEKARMDKQNEKNRNVSYRWWELILMLLFAPFYLVRGEKELVAILLFLPVYLLSRTPVDFSVSRIKTVEGRKIRSEIQATAYSIDFRRCNVFFIDLL